MSRKYLVSSELLSLISSKISINLVLDREVVRRTNNGETTGCLLDDLTILLNNNRDRGCGK